MEEPLYNIAFFFFFLLFPPLLHIRIWPCSTYVYKGLREKTVNDLPEG